MEPRAVFVFLPRLSSNLDSVALWKATVAPPLSSFNTTVSATAATTIPERGWAPACSSVIRIRVPGLTDISCEHAAPGETNSAVTAMAMTQNIDDLAIATNLTARILKTY